MLDSIEKTVLTWVENSWRTITQVAAFIVLATFLIMFVCVIILIVDILTTVLP